MRSWYGRDPDQSPIASALTLEIEPPGAGTARRMRLHYLTSVILEGVRVEHVGDPQSCMLHLSRQRHEFLRDGEDAQRIAIQCDPAGVQIGHDCDVGFVRAGVLDLRSQ